MIVSYELSDIRYDIERYEWTINLILLCRNLVRERLKNVIFYPKEENFHINSQINNYIVNI